MPPAKIGCKGCRLSKVKCDLRDSTTGTCSRCARLGLSCFPTGPTRRCRAASFTGASRLGPEVRRLLRTDVAPTDGSGRADVGPGQVAAPPTTAFAAPPVGRPFLVDKGCLDSVHRAYETPVLISHLKTAAARRAWFRQILYTVHRAKSLGEARALRDVHAHTAAARAPPTGRMATRPRTPPRTFRRSCRVALCGAGSGRGALVRRGRGGCPRG